MLRFRDKNFNGFTLVELIVVIVILAILATIAFLSFSSQSGSARDSVRLSDVTNIKKGLEMRQITAGVLPSPVSPKTFTGSSAFTGDTSVSISKGKINASNLPALSAGIKDPAGTEYDYATISSKGAAPIYYQIALELENPTSRLKDMSNPFMAYMEDYRSYGASGDTVKVMKLKGNYAFDPVLPSLFILSDTISSSSGGIYDPSLCFAIDNSTTNTLSNKTNCIPKVKMNMMDFDSSLVGYWDMETTTTGGQIKDLSGNGNNGTFSGGMVFANALTGGIIGKGLNFNGTGDFIEIADSPSLKTDKDLTVTAMINPKNILKGRQAVVFKHYNNEYEAIMEPTGTISYYHGDFDGIAGRWEEMTEPSNYAFTQDKGNMFTITRNTSNKTLKFYINGILKGEDTYVAIPAKSSNPVLLGSRYTTTYFFQGIIDEVKIYNSVLSPEQILSNAKAAGF